MSHRLALWALFLALHAGAQINNSSGAGGVQNPTTSGTGSGCSLTGCTLTGPLTSPSLISTGQPVYNVLGYGALGNGSHDDTAAIAAAATACGAGGILFFPGGTAGAFLTSQPVIPPGNCDIEIDGTLKATAAMSAVLNIGGNGRAQLGHLWGSGTIDSNNLASRHIWMTNYNVYEISGVTLLNTASLAGIDIGKAGAQSQAGAYIHDMTLWVPVGTASIPGSVGIWEDTGSDASVGPNIVIGGYDISVRDSIGGNMPFKDIHAYGTSANNLPTTCFDSVHGNAQWVNDECDTPIVSGIHAHSFTDYIDHFQCYNNSAFGSDNVVNCIVFDQPNPFSTISSSRYLGADSSHRIAADVVASSMEFITTTGNTEANVVTFQSLNQNLRNATLWDTAGVQNSLVFQGSGTNYWSMQKGVGNDLQLIDNVGNFTRLDITSNGITNFTNPGTNAFNFGIGGLGVFTITPTTSTFNSAADTSYNLNLNSGLSASQSDNIQFRDLGSVKWFITKDASNNLNIFDQAMSSNRLVFTPNGGMVITNNGALTHNNVTGNYNFNIASTRYLTVSTSGVQIGTSGSPIAAKYSGSGTLTYTSITAPACQEQPLTVTGAAPGDACYASTGSTDIGTTFAYAGCRVSATNTAQIKVCATVTGTPTATTWTGWATH